MRKIRMGMVGGGQGAFIGAIHRIAAQMDNHIELVCGAFSRSADICTLTGKALYLPEHKCYSSYQQMFEQESDLPEGERMDMVAIVTPNYLHFPVAKMALEYGFHVMSDKPATANLDEAVALREILRRNKMLYGLTHTYTGYPMVKEAKHRISRGDIGRILKVVVEYPQGWLSTKEAEQSKQAAWRLDPKQAGISCCMGDIGVHAANLAEYMTGAKITRICANLSTHIEGRLLDDDGTVLLQFDNGSHGVLQASQISVGEENNLNIRIYGESASLEWSQIDPNSMWLKFADQPKQRLRVGVGEFCPIAQANMRTPAGHPEGYLEAFANLYTQFSYQVRHHLGLSAKPLTEAMLDVPGIDEAVRGMAFIEHVVTASKADTKWHDIVIPKTPFLKVCE